MCYHLHGFYVKFVYNTNYRLSNSKTGFFLLKKMDTFFLYFFERNLQVDIDIAYALL